MKRAKNKPLIMTASSLGCLFSCPRKYYMSYVLGWRKIHADEALRMGTAIHAGLEARAKGKEFTDAVGDMMNTVGSEEVDALMASTASALLAGYYRKWDGDKEVMTIEPEKEFAVRFPFLRGVVLCGKIDGIVKFANGNLGIIEHKTTAQDIGIDSDYWQYINRDQVALYKAACEKMGIDVITVVYDVIRKPGMRPYKETPIEKRKYTKDGRLYATCHDADETADSWTRRLGEDIASKMDEYYARRELPILSSDMDRLARRVYAAKQTIRLYNKIAKTMDEQGAKPIEGWPKCGSAMICRSCPYRGVCDDEDMNEAEWERGRAHEELAIVNNFG